MNERRVQQLAVLLVGMPAMAAAEPACATASPAGLSGPARWLGPCAAGHAEGLGVLRTGSAAPFGFFAGHMTAGRPGAGLIVRPDGLFEVASGFDAAGRPLPTDSLHPERQDAVFKLAAAAARATADRLGRAGNRSSADYYRRLARRITAGQPE